MHKTLCPEGLKKSEVLRLSDETKAKEAFKQMTPKEKISHIWEYYRLHIIGGLAFLIFAGGLINSIFINPPKSPYVSFAFLGDFIPEERLSAFIQDLDSGLEFNRDKLEVAYNNFYTSDSDPQASMAMGQRLYAMIAAKDIDFFVCDRSETQALYQNQFLMPLNSLFTPEELEGLTLFTIDGSSYAIHIKDTRFNKYLESPNFDLCIVSNSERTEAVKAVVKEVTGK